jgi:VanZ family protein
MFNSLNTLLFSPRFQQARYFTAIVLYLLILIVGSVPGTRADVGEYASGVVLHSCAYAVLTFLLFSGSPGSLNARAVKSVVTIALMGALDEFVQSFFPYRHAAVSDWVVDCSSAIFMAVVLRILWPKLVVLVKT